MVFWALRTSWTRAGTPEYCKITAGELLFSLLKMREKGATYELGSREGEGGGDLTLTVVVGDAVGKPLLKVARRGEGERESSRLGKKEETDLVDDGNGGEGLAKVETKESRGVGDRPGGSGTGGGGGRSLGGGLGGSL